MIWCGLGKTCYWNGLNEGVKASKDVLIEDDVVIKTIKEKVYEVLKKKINI